MPTYEYMCEKCDHEFEREQRISDPPVKTCPECRSRKVKKLISRTSFVLKGGGWYSDLYASPTDSSKKEGAKDADASGSSGDTKADTADSKKSSDSQPSKAKESKATDSSKSKSSKQGKKGKSAA